MNVSIIPGCIRVPAAVLALSLLVSSCGGGSSSPDNQNPLSSSTGTVGLLFTDKPTDDFSAIKLSVVEAILIGGDDGQQVLFQGDREIDLLDLTNYSEPIVFGEVRADVYTKVRLIIDNLELVPHDGGDSIFPRLPANGKIDLLDPGGINVLPGRMLLIEIDMDANKSIHIVGAGNSGNYNFRPVVKANFMDGGLPDKLARLEGTVAEIATDGSGSFVLCHADTPDECVTVNTSDATCVFDEQGLPSNTGALMAGDAVVVIGRYSLHINDVKLDSLIVELGDAEQVSGRVVSAPVDSQFLVVSNDNNDVVVELQDGTKYFNADGPLGEDAIVVGAALEVEGVRPAKVNPTDPDLIRAALVFVEDDDDEQLSGTIIEPLDVAGRSFGLTVEGASADTCVRVNEGADILLVDAAASEVTIGTINDLAVGQVVDLFGITAVDSCFDANEVLIDVNAGTT